MQHVIEERERPRNARSSTFRLEEEHLANKPKNMAATLARRQKQLHLVRKQQQADFITAARSRDSQGPGNFGGKLTLREA